MPKVTFLTPDDSRIVVDDGHGTLMEIARDHNVEGIDGSCGGVCSCATCHVKILPEWLSRVGPADPTEQDLLDLNDGTDRRSRLSCQIEMNDKLDGLVVEVVPL